MILRLHHWEFQLQKRNHPDLLPKALMKFQMGEEKYFKTRTKKNI